MRTTDLLKGLFAGALVVLVTAVLTWRQLESVSLGPERTSEGPDAGVMGSDKYSWGTLAEVSNDITMLDSSRRPVMEIKANGEIWVRGERVDDNKEVYDLFVKFMRGECDCVPPITPQ
jgi:hypothetical protein